MDQCIPTQDGVPYVQWIYYVFGDCVYGTQAAASLLLGYLSILAWLNAQLPQVVENYKLGSADCLSLNFLAIWLAGDLCNLLGCILTHQLPFQLYLGIYFVSIDICLLAQWIYYSKIKRRSSFPVPVQPIHTIKYSSFQHPSARTPLLIQSNANKTLEDELTPYSVSASPSKWYTLTSTHHDDDDDNRSNKSFGKKTGGTALFAMMLLGFNLSNTDATSSITTSSVATYDPAVFGQIIAWTCTALYLTSRIPQILKNHNRQSVEGLSPSLFMFAACGHDYTTLSALPTSSAHEDVTAIIHVKDRSSIKQQLDAIRSQSVAIRHVWVVCPSSLRSSVEYHTQDINRTRIITIDIPQQPMATLGSTGQAGWLQIISTVETPLAWVLDGGVPGPQHLEYIYNALQSEEYQDALLGTHATLLPSNLNGDKETRILCLPEDFDRIPTTTQPVDMIHGAWLFRKAWYSYLTAETPDSLALPLAHHISQTLHYHANVPTIVLPTPDKDRQLSMTADSCADIRQTFKKNDVWRRRLELRTSPAALDYRQVAMLQRQQKRHTLLFVADGPEQALALHPLMCRFTYPVHVVVTGAIRGLTGRRLEKVLEESNCSDIIVHDVDIIIEDEIMAATSAAFGISRLVQILKPQVLIHVQKSNYFFQALEVAAKAQDTAIIGLPAEDVRHSLWISELSLDILQHWHSMNINLVVVTDRRPHALSRLLQSLSRSHLLGDKVDLTIQMEQSADSVTQSLVNSFVWRHGDKLVRHRIKKGGLMPAIIESWYPKDRHDYAVILEDDVEVSPFFYTWAKYSILQYRYSGNLKASQLMYGVSMYSPRNIELLPQGRRPWNAEKVLSPRYPSHMPYVSQVPCSWGAVYFPEHWREFHTYLTARLEDEKNEHLLNITVPRSRSVRWKKSWKKYFIELVYLRAYVMLYPNFQRFESFSTNHLEFGTHVKKERRHKTIDTFLVPLMQRNTILAQLPDHRLPSFEHLPVLDLWGRLVNHEHLEYKGALLHRKISACSRIYGQFDPEDLLCPMQRTEDEIAQAQLAANVTKKPKEVKSKDVIEPLVYVTVNVQSREDIVEDEENYPKPINVALMPPPSPPPRPTIAVPPQSEEPEQDNELQDLESELHSLHRLHYQIDIA
ncbi:hypothetical protein DFQ29_009899 [Apophysomyces sp. BC1021]|nr:hypothetical protein DFQ29_009899 [Apophysomyces sp. BC1021]